MGLPQGIQVVLEILRGDGPHVPAEGGDRMSKELVIGSNRHETKVAILEEDQLVEVYFQRANEYSLAGSIHKGRVTRVLPGMQSAFVDLGLERDTFLYVSDFFEEHDDIDTVDEKPPRPANVASGLPSRSGERTGGDRGPREQFANRRDPERQEVERTPLAGGGSRSRVSRTDSCRRGVPNERSGGNPSCSRRSQGSGTHGRRRRISGRSTQTAVPPQEAARPRIPGN